MSRWIIILIMFVCTACSNKDLYNNLQKNQRQLCEKEPRSTYEECIQRLNKSYMEYESERDQLLEKKKTKSEKY